MNYLKKIFVVVLVFSTLGICFLIRGDENLDSNSTMKNKEDSSSIDLDVDSDNDGTVEQNDKQEDNIEEFAPGCIIPVTDSESDNEKIPVPSNPNNTDIRVPLKLKISPTVTTGSLVLGADSGIKIWTAQTGGTEIVLPKTYSDVTTAPDTLYVDGITVGANPDIILTLKDTSGNPIAEDKVKVLVVEPISYAPRKNIAYLWVSRPTLGTDWEAYFKAEVNMSGFDDIWFTDSTPEATNYSGQYNFDFETCTLTNFKKLANSGVYTVNFHGMTGYSLVVYAAYTPPVPGDTAEQIQEKNLIEVAANDACVAWKSNESNMYIDASSDSDGAYYAVKVTAAWYVNNFKNTADLNKTICFWGTCYGASLLDSVGGRWKLGYSAECVESLQCQDWFRFLGFMNGHFGWKEGNRKNRTAGKALAQGGYTTNKEVNPEDPKDNHTVSAVMKGYKWTTLNAAPMLKTDTSVYAYPTSPPSDDRLYWGGIIFDTYMNNNISASQALTFSGSGTGSTDTPFWAGNISGHPFSIGFYFSKTGKTATALSSKCRTEDASATDIDNNGRPLDGNGEFGPFFPSRPDNKTWSW